MSPIPPDCGDNVTVNVDSELLPPVDGHDCNGDPTVEQGNPIVAVGVTDVRIACSLITLDVVDTTPAVERKLDGDDISGAGSIVIPDGVLSFGVSVVNAGAGVTIDGPDYAAPVNLATGVSVNASGDGKNTINGPITVTTTAGSVVVANWMFP